MKIFHLFIVYHYIFMNAIPLCIPLEIGCDNYEGYKCIISNVFADENENYINFIGTRWSYYGMTTLQFHNCQLHLIPPTIFLYFNQLNSLDLSNSGIIEISENTFEVATNLNNLNFSNNKLNRLSNLTFAGAIKLKYLDLSHNHIDCIQLNAFHTITELKTLILSDNIIEQLPITIFDKLINLKILQLHENMLTKLDASLFFYNINLFEITLNDNFLTQINANQFLHLHKINQFDISNNPIENFDIIKINARVMKMSSINAYSCFIGERLNNLDASNNNINKIIINDMNGNENDTMGLIVHRKKLKYLNLSNNKLVSMNDLTKLKYLEYLDLSQNLFEHLNLLDFFRMNHLEILNLKNSCNNIECIYSDRKSSNATTNLTILSNLKILNLSYNKLMAINLLEFKCARKLQELYLDGNNFRELHNIENIRNLFPRLQTIGISNNPWNCTMLKQIITILNNYNIKLHIDKEIIITNNNKQNWHDNIFGISCLNVTQINNVNELILPIEINEKLNYILENIKLLNISNNYYQYIENNLNNFKNDLELKFTHLKSDIDMIKIYLNKQNKTNVLQSN